MKKIIYIFLITGALACENVKQNSNCQNLVKIKITDTSFKKNLFEYIEHFHFHGKGVYLTTIIKKRDTTLYYVLPVFSKKSLNSFTEDSKYIQYDTVNNRIVVVYTKFENFIENQYPKYDCDTILDKYFESEPFTGFREVYLIEYANYKDSVSKRVVKNHSPFR